LRFTKTHFLDPDILTNKSHMDERTKLAADNPFPDEILMGVSKTYTDIAEKIIGEKIIISDNPKEEILKVLKDEYQLVD